MFMLLIEAYLGIQMLHPKTDSSHKGSYGMPGSRFLSKLVEAMVLL